MSEKALSLCMIVKNEAAILPRCLDSVHALTPEIVIVDTGSADATTHIARSYGATVEPFDFNTVHFGAARNRTLELASGRWILVLDADEVLDPSTVPFLQQIVATHENAGYYFERVNIQAGVTRSGSGPVCKLHQYPRSKSDYVVRLFPNQPDYRYRGRVHEMIDGSILAAGGRLLRSKIRIEHDFASDPEARRRKNLWYIEILNQEILDDPRDSGRLDFLAAEYHQLGRFDAAMEITERIVTLRPHDPEAHLRAGIYHLLHKIDRERARRDFHEALRLRPGYTEAESFLQLLK
jgi:glycosyltransferase involved in cell wall biosynthesis